jgi:uncharacterized protein YndB with AHSA1/START domain
MNEQTPIARVFKSVHVKAPVEHTFKVFTEGLTRWWPHNHGVGPKPIVKDWMECRLGGRWLELSEGGVETVVATIIEWQPPHRLVLLWQINADWKPDPSMKSEVDVRFTAQGPNETLVEVLHHKFETMGIAAGTKMRNDVDGGWPGLLALFTAEAESEK